MEDFNKDQWIRELKVLNKEWKSEEDQMLKPLILTKKENIEFIDECVRLKTKLKQGQTQTAKFKIEGIYDVRSKVKKASDVFEKIHMGEVPDTHMLKIQKLATEIQEGINTFKLSSRKEYQELAIEENAIMADLENLEQKYDAIQNEEKDTTFRSTTRSSFTAKQRPASASRLTQNVEKPPANPELAQLKAKISLIEDELFKLGGFNLGWRASDHQDFLRIYTKYGDFRAGSLAFANEVIGCIPDQTIDSIKEHLQQFRQ